MTNQNSTKDYTIDEKLSFTDYASSFADGARNASLFTCLGGCMTTFAGVVTSVSGQTVGSTVLVNSGNLIAVGGGLGMVGAAFTGGVAALYYLSTMSLEYDRRSYLAGRFTAIAAPLAFIGGVAGLATDAGEGFIDQQTVEPSKAAIHIEGQKCDSDAMKAAIATAQKDPRFAGMTITCAPK